ncbi:MAG: metalloregulator ArsR/SmtB family transcription factor [Henriciella sp.]|nr:metalloregulator ArsR/SmtB family transcription factor [Henriciella sp.]
MKIDPETLVDALKAAGEPTRLRLLALLRQGDLAVGELVQILKQSQPRLSHHLKTLTTAGLVERLPEGSWVYYRATSKGWPRRLLDTLFAEIDLGKAAFAADRTALNDIRQQRLSTANAYFEAVADDWDRIRALHFPNEAIEKALLEVAQPGPLHRVVDLGTGTGRMLALFAPRAAEAEGLDLSHQMLTVARANLAKAGVTNARVRQGDVAATPFETDSAELVIIHQVLHYIEDPAAVIAEAARILRPGGQLLIVDFAPHDLAFLQEQHGHRRLGLRLEDMQEWADAANLSLAPPRRFDPPDSLDQGLSVLIWSAARPKQKQEVAA